MMSLALPSIIVIARHGFLIPKFYCSLHSSLILNTILALTEMGELNRIDLILKIIGDVLSLGNSVFLYLIITAVIATVRLPDKPGTSIILRGPVRHLGKVIRLYFKFQKYRNPLIRILR